MAGPERIDHHDLQIGPIEGHVVVAAVKQDDVGVVALLGHPHDRLVIDAGIDDVPGDDVRLILLHLLDRAVMLVEVLDLGKSLDLLGLQIAVGHRVADGDDRLFVLPEDIVDVAGGLRLAAAGRTAQIEITGLVDLSMVVLPPMSTKLAPSAVTRADIDIT